MNRWVRITLAPVLLAASIVSAEEIQSGIGAGKTMLSMPIEKRGGIDDGVQVGDTICYT